MEVGRIKRFRTRVLREIRLGRQSSGDDDLFRLQSLLLLLRRGADLPAILSGLKTVDLCVEACSLIYAKSFCEVCEVAVKYCTRDVLAL